MNIVQLEDDIKSLPDDRLMTEMQAPTGGFPQYLVSVSYTHLRAHET